MGFKVGDYVRVGELYTCDQSGEVAVIDRVLENGYQLREINGYPHDGCDPVPENKLTLANEENRVSEFKKGDKVRIVKRIRGNTTGLMDWALPNGDAGKVGVITSVGTGYWTVYDKEDGDNYYGLFTKEELEKVSTIEVGTVLQKEGANYDYKVIAVVESSHGELVITEDQDCTDDVRVHYPADMKRLTVKGDIKEVTLQEVADKMGIDVKQLRIKE